MKNLYDINDWIDITERQKVGEILMQAGIMNLLQLDMALNVQKFQKNHVGEILVSMKIITREQLDAALALQAQINGRFEEDL